MKKYPVIIGLIIFSLILSGCQIFYTAKPDQSKPGSGTDSPLPDGYGMVQLSVNWGTGRTVLPDNSLDLFKIEFNFFYYDENEDEQQISLVVEPNNGKYRFALPEGYYSLELKVSLADDPENILIAEEFIEGIVVEAGELTEKSITLYPFSTEDGTGTLDLTLTLESGDDFFVEVFTMINLDDGSRINCLTVNDGNNISISLISPITHSYYDTNFPSGYYVLHVRLLNSDKDAYAFKTDIIHITDNLSSSEEYIFSEDDFVTSWPFINSDYILAYLNSLNGGENAGDPVNLSVNLNFGDMTQSDNTAWEDLLHVLELAEKYVNLDLSDSVIKDGTAFNPYYEYESGQEFIVSITLPNQAQSIADGEEDEAVFNYFSNLKSFDGESLTVIGDYAFYDLRGLNMTSLPAGINSIGDSAFYNCRNLNITSLPEGIISIGDYAFQNCRGITSFTWPSSIDIIGEGIFQVSGLCSIELPSTLIEIGKGAFNGCDGLTGINCPESLEIIGDQAFSWTGLTQIELNEGLEFINDSAFLKCSSLTNVSIPASVTTIDTCAFSSCESLESVVFSPDGTEPVFFGGSVFSGCESLTTVELPSIIHALPSEYYSKPLRVNTLSDYTFYNCKSLENIILPEGLIEIDDNVFSLCEKLTDIQLPSTLETIGEDAFYYCIALTEIDLPLSLKTIRSDAFTLCGFEKIELPANLVSIGNKAFNRCESLTTVICHGTTPPTLGSWVFSIGFIGEERDSDILTAIYVPDDAVITYLSAGYWANYSAIIKSINEMVP